MARSSSCILRLQCDTWDRVELVEEVVEHVEKHTGGSMNGWVIVENPQIP